MAQPGPQEVLGSFPLLRSHQHFSLTGDDAGRLRETTVISTSGFLLRVCDIHHCSPAN